ncbi:MAG: ABC transporter substrate-binding protein [Sulfolobales archaeon]
MNKRGISKTVFVSVAVVMLIIGLVAGYAIGTMRPTAVPAVPVATIERTVAPTGAPAGVVTVTVAGAGPTGLAGEIPIGFPIPLTGVLSTFGAQYRVVVEKAVDEINSYLASLGRQWRIKAIIEDTATEPKTCLDKVMALHARGVKVFIGIASSAEVSEVKSYADANKLLIISPSSTSPRLAIPDMILRYTPNDLYQGKAIAKIMWLRGARYITIIYRGDTWGDGLYSAVRDNFDKICKTAGGGCGLLEPIRYDPAAKEFSAEAAKLNSIVSDAVSKYGADKVGVVAISFEEAAALIAAAKQYDVLGKVIWQGSDGTAAVTPLLDPAVAEFGVKVKFYNTMASPGVSPFKEKIRKWVKDALGQEPMGYTYFVYDAIWTVALTIDAIGKYDGEAIKNTLPLILQHYMGASGYIELDENGDRKVGDYDLWAIVKEGDRYMWKVIGLYKGLTDTIEFYS